MAFWTQRAANQAIGSSVSASLGLAQPGAKWVIVAHSSGFNRNPTLSSNLTGGGWTIALDPVTGQHAVGDTGDSVVTVFERTVLVTDPSLTVTLFVAPITPSEQLSIEAYEVPNLGPVDRVVLGASLFGQTAFPVGPTAALTAAGEVSLAAWTTSSILTSAGYSGGFVEDTRQARGAVAEIGSPSTAGMASTLTAPSAMNGVGVLVVWQKAVIPIALNGTHFTPNFGTPLAFIPGPQTIRLGGGRYTDTRSDLYGGLDSGYLLAPNFGVPAVSAHAAVSSALLEDGSHWLLEDGSYLLLETPTVIVPAGFHITPTFGTVTRIAGAAAVRPSGFRIPVTFGARQVIPGGITRTLTGFAVPTHFGRPAPLLDGSIAPDGLFITVGFGTPALLPGEVVAALAGFSVPVTFGTLAGAADVTVPIAGFDASPDFGFPTLLAENSIGPAGFQVVPQFGAIVFAGGDVTVMVGGYPVPILFGGTDLGGSIHFDGIALTISFGVPGILAENTIRFSGLHVLVKFGAVRLISGAPVTLIPRRAQVYNVGQRARIVVIFEQPDGSRFDPVTVQVKIKSPAGSIVTHTYDGTTTAIVRAQPGVYYADFVPDRSGFWRARWIGDAPGVGIRRELVVAVREPRAALVTHP